MPDRDLTDPEAPRPRVQSAARAVGILLAVAQSENGLGTREVSEQVGIGRQATYHLLHTLLATGMLTRDDRNRYLLGFRVGTLAEGFERQLGPSERLGPAVRALARATGETAFASGWWSGEIMALSSAPGANPVQAAEVPRGYTGAAHARAAGKLLLACAAPAVRKRYLERHELERLTPKTITSPAALERELEQIRDQGYAIDDEEFAAGVGCIAVPFEAASSRFVLALSAPRERLMENQADYLATMRRIVQLAVSGRLDRDDADARAMARGG